MRKRTPVHRLAILFSLAVLMGASLTCFKDDMDFQTNESSSVSAVRFISINNSPTSAKNIPSSYFLGNPDVRSVAQAFRPDKDYYISGVWTLLQRTGDFNYSELPSQSGDVVIAYIYGDGNNNYNNDDPTNPVSNPSGSLMAYSAGAYIQKIATTVPNYSADMIAFAVNPRVRLKKGKIYWVVFEISWKGDSSPTPINNRYTDPNIFLDFYMTSGGGYADGAITYRNYGSGWQAASTARNFIMWVDGITAN